MEPQLLFYKVFLDSKGEKKYLGTAFPITPSGHFLTCYHVVDQPMNIDDQLCLFDNTSKVFQPFTEMIFDKSKDIAILLNPLNRVNEKYFPILDPSKLIVGSDVYTYGYFINQFNRNIITDGFFKGSIVNFGLNVLADYNLTITLPFPIIEGLSGSPLLIFHNGVKLAGLNLGNNEYRVEQSRVIEYADEKKEIQEVTSRIVEFGIALHPTIIIQYLKSIGINDFLVSSETTDIE